jgi:Bacterial PH domain
MPGPSAPPEALRTLRQWGSVTMGVIAMVLTGGMALWSVLSGDPSLIFVGLMLFACGASWVLLVRPAIVFTMVGVELRNPFRHTRIAWSQIEDVSARWNPEVWARGRSYHAWAIASHIERPRSSGVLSLGRLGTQASIDAAKSPKPSGGATVGSASRLIETGMAEYAELVAEGDSAVVQDGELTQEWQWSDIAAIGVPLLLVLVGLLL